MAESDEQNTEVEHGRRPAQNRRLVPVRRTGGPAVLVGLVAPDEADDQEDDREVGQDNPGERGEHADAPARLGAVFKHEHAAHEIHVSHLSETRSGEGVE